MSFIEKLFGRLMNEPGAAVALERAQALHPIKAADQHKLALLDHDTVTALALEYSVRARAMTHFHEGENLRALSTVERNLKNGLGRMGSGGAAIFQAVADDIVEQLARGNYERDIDNKDFICAEVNDYSSDLLIVIFDREKHGIGKLFLIASGLS